MAKGKAINVVTINFSTDKGNWSSLISEGFKAELIRTLSNTSFTELTYNPDPKLAPQQEGNVNSSLKSLHPDLIFFTDDLIYDTFSQTAFDLNIPVVHVSIYNGATYCSYKRNVKQIGVVAEVPVRRILEVAKEFKAPKKMGIIGGPFVGAERIAQNIETELTKDGIGSIKVLSGDWEQWKKSLTAWNDNVDFVWLLFPFGVRLSNNEQVDFSVVNEWIQNNLKVPTIGIGSAGSRAIKKTIGIGMEASDIGKEAAKKASMYLSTSIINKVNLFNSYQLYVSKSELKRLNIKVPGVLALQAIFEE